MVTKAAFLSVLDNFSELHAAPLVFYIAYYFAAVILLAYIYTRVWFYARRRVLKQIITTQYEPPIGLNPPEVSYLFRKRLDQSDFSALLLHMAQRGVIHFRKHDTGKVVLPGPKYEGTLKGYERLILDVLDENKAVKVTELLNSYETIFVRDRHYRTFRKQVEHELTKGRHIKKTRLLTRIISRIKPVLFVMSLLVWSPLLLAWIRTLLVLGTSDLASVFDVMRNILIASGLGLVPAVLFVLFVEFIQNKYTGRRHAFRLKPDAIWAQLVGYRQYVKHIRSGKLRFEANYIEKSASLNTLPYAIALDQVPHWKDIVT